MSYRFNKFNRRFTRATAGFTLIEMIVVIAIFGIVTTIILANLPTFRDRSSLDLVAQEVAINIRGAQVFGASGRVQEVVGKPTYRITFNPSDKQSFSLVLLNGKFNETYRLSGGFEIESVCLSNTQDTLCSPGSQLIGIQFTRPKLEPQFYNGDTLDDSAVEANIVIRSLRSKETRLVKVWKNGQISVTKPTANPTN